MVDASRTISITEARKRIFEIADEVQTPGVHFTLTEKGKPRMLVMSPEEFEGWMETLDIMAEDPGALDAIKEAQEDFKKGYYVTLEELRKEYGISDTSRPKRKKRIRKA